VQRLIKLKTSVLSTITLLAFFCSLANAQSTVPTVEENYATWYQWPASQGGNDHWYGLVRVSMPGQKAETAAERWGGHLASYSDAAERDLLSRITKIRFYNQAYWIALVAEPGERYKWTDGTAFNPDLLGFNVSTNGSSSAERMTFTPFGFQQPFPDYVYGASLFEVTAHPSTLPAAINEVRVSSLEASYMAYPIVPSGAVRVRSPGVANFTVGALGPGPLQFQWKVGGVPIADATNSAFALQVTTSSTGAVSVAVSNLNGGQESVPAPIEVVPIVITSTNAFWKQWPKSQGGNDHWYGVRQGDSTYAQAVDFAARVGADLVTLQTKEEEDAFIALFSWHFFDCWLGVRTNNTGGYEWIDGSAVSYSRWAAGQPDATMTNASAVVVHRDDGLWQVAPVDTALISVAMERTNSPTEIPPIILDELAPIRLSVGATNRLEFDVVGGPPLFYEWRHQEQALPSQTNAVLQFCPTNILESGDYVLVVSNAFGRATSAPVKVTVVLGAPMQLKASVFENYIRLEFNHPDDADTVTVEGSWDMVTWWNVEGSSIPGPHEFVESIQPTNPQVFYRLHRYP
jgi:hypothetical protein